MLCLYKLNLCESKKMDFNGKAEVEEEKPSFEEFIADTAKANEEKPSFEEFSADTAKVDEEKPPFDELII